MFLRGWTNVSFLQCVFVYFTVFSLARIPIQFCIISQFLASDYHITTFYRVVLINTENSAFAVVLLL